MRVVCANAQTISSDGIEGENLSLMVTIKFYLDTRQAKEVGYALRINITHRRKTASFPLGILLNKEQWNGSSIINHSEAKFFNTLISKRKVEVDKLILKLEDDEPEKLATMTAVDIRDYVVAKLPPTDQPKPEKKPKEDPNTFLKWFDRFMERKKGRMQKILMHSYGLKVIDLPYRVLPSWSRRLSSCVWR